MNLATKVLKLLLELLQILLRRNKLVSQILIDWIRHVPNLMLSEWHIHHLYLRIGVVIKSLLWIELLDPFELCPGTILVRQVNLSLFDLRYLCLVLILIRIDVIQMCSLLVY